MSKRKNIPVESEPIVNCQDCSGECCKAGTGIGLNRRERFSHGAKMSLITVIEPVPVDRIVPALSDQEDPTLIPADTGIYKFIKDCGYLTTNNLCSIYDSPDKPQACDTLNPGSIPCLIIRAKAGYEDDLPSATASVVLDALLEK